MRRSEFARSPVHRTPHSFPVRARLGACLAFAIALSQACGGAQPSPPLPVPAGPYPPVAVAPVDRASSAPATPAGAEAFIEQVNADLKRLYVDAERIAWVKATYITDDTERLEAQAQERVMEYLSRRILEARRFEGIQLSPDLARQFYLLKYSAGLPAPTNAAERAELADIASRLESIYGKGKYCSPKLKGLGKDKTEECLAIDDLGEGPRRKARLRSLARHLARLARDRAADAPDVRALRRARQQGRARARLRGHARDLAGGYDMSAGRVHARDGAPVERGRAALRGAPLLRAREASRAVRRGQDRQGQGPDPRARARQHVGAGVGQPLPDGRAVQGQGPARRHEAAAGAKKYDPKKMVELGERFFMSLGMDPLPKTFWERSMFTKPEDRDVVCHASAWDVDMRRRPPHQDVHQDRPRGPGHDPPRARPQLLLPLLQPPPAAVSGRRERRLPRRHRRHARAQRHARRT